MTNYIFFDDRLQKRAGGPSTYLYNLKNGIDELSYQKIKFIYNTTKKNDTIGKSKNNIKKLIYKYPRVYERLLMVKRKKRSNLYNELSSKVNDGDTVMFHMTSDLAKAMKYLPKDCTKVLMSHSPEVAAKQMSAELCSKFKDSKYNFSYTEKEYFNKFDLVAFKNADILVFPSKESMEPYYQTIDNFEDIIKNKKIEFVLTGTEKLKYKVSRNNLRRKYNIPQGAFVLTFIGRHNLVKGYDIFVDICSKLINKYKDIYIITAGVGDIPSLEHERWIDVGWTDDPGSIANASDIFILPNRRTYFDLVLIEMLSIGKTCVVSNTGGNKTISKYTTGVITYNDVNDAIKKINNIYKDKEKLKLYSKNNLEAYERNFTIELFSKRYIELMDKISRKTRV